MRPWRRNCADKGRARRQNSPCAPGRWHPLSFDETFLPFEIGKKIITNNLKVEPIFSLLERKYDVPLIEAEYKLDAVPAGIEVAAALKVKPQTPIFRIERTSYSTGGRPVDYETLHYRGDLVQFVTRLVRKIPH
jgi:GntR family transcriptional regulator